MKGQHAIFYKKKIIGVEDQLQIYEMEEYMSKTNLNKTKNY